MLDAEAVNAIAALAQRADHPEATTRDVTLDGKVYTFRTTAHQYGRDLGALLTPPSVDVLHLSTLTGFVDAIHAGAYDPAHYLIHIDNHLNASLKERTTDAWGKRATIVRATHEPIDAFKFDYFYSDPQRFIIALQVAFLPTEESLYLIRLASNLKAGNSVQTEDDGFSQTVTLRAGEVSTAEVKVKPRIKLIPLRTFPEAAPVQSEFLIRFQQTPQASPSIALFDVDGKKWQGELMQSIKTWLNGKIDAGFPVIA